MVMKTVIMKKHVYDKLLEKKQELEQRDKRIWSMGNVVEEMISNEF